MATREAFQRVAREESDQTFWLVYADWLEENGFGMEGEDMRLQAEGQRITTWHWEWCAGGDG